MNKIEKITITNREVGSYYQPILATKNDLINIADKVNELVDAHNIACEDKDNTQYRKETQIQILKLLNKEVEETRYRLWMEAPWGSTYYYRSGGLDAYGKVITLIDDMLANI